MEQRKFNTILTDNQVGNIIEINDFKELGDNEQIIKAECVIDWFIEPVFTKRGIDHWNVTMKKFNCILKIEDIDTREERSIEFDNGSNNYDMDINLDDYKMTYDFLITKIKINRQDVHAIAYING